MSVSNELNDTPVKDPGFIKRLESADGWVALFATPEKPYYSIVPVAKWSHVKRDGVDVVEALVPALGDTALVSITDMPFDYEFITYAYLPAQASQLLMLGGRTPFDIMIQIAATRGERMARERQRREIEQHLRLVVSNDDDAGEEGDEREG